MIEFGTFIDGWKLIDSLLNEAKYTWSNFRDIPSLSRLDRFLFYNEWEELFPGKIQCTLPRSLSDHTSILLQMWKRQSGPYPFKFEESWFCEPDFRILWRWYGISHLIWGMLVGYLP